MQVLNIDKLIKPTRAITINGIEYPMSEMSVGLYLKAVEKEKQAQENQDQTPQVMINSWVDDLIAIFPTCPRDVFLAQTVETLTAIIAFARDGSLPDETKVEGEEEKKAES